MYSPYDKDVKAVALGNWTVGECFYVSVVDAGRYQLLAGPFKTHQDALDMVDAARDAALNYGDPKAWFYAYGTVKMVNGHRSGILNGKLGI